MHRPLTLTPAETSLLTLLPDGEVAGRLRRDGLPGRGVEEWRWSDLRRHLGGELVRAGSFDGDLPPAPVPVPEAVELVFANGRLLHQPAYLPDGVSLSRAGENLPLPIDRLAAITAGLADEVWHLELSGAVEVPLLLRFIGEGDGVAASRLIVSAGTDSSVSLIETDEGGGAGQSLSLVELALSAGASVSRVVLQTADAGTRTIIRSALVSLAREASFSQTVLSPGGAFVRQETQLIHAGNDSKAVLNGAWLLSGTRHFDHTATVSHGGTGCETRSLAKGVLSGRSRGIFQGKFHVARGAQKTDAQMGHHALLLSDEAEVKAKPELEIYADDVECAHGNTSGALDEDALFYMRQRGLPEKAARALLVESFVREVLEGIGDAAVRDCAATLTSEWMEALS